MPGSSDFSAQAYLDWQTGARPMALITGRFLALFTTAPTSDSGTGGTEVSTSGTAYARQQIAGLLTASAAWTTSSTTITLSAAAPSWLTALGTNGSGVNVYDATSLQQIGTISSISGTTVTLAAAAAHASSGSSDQLFFSAFPLSSASSGTEPSVTPASSSNSAQINFPTATSGGYGTVVAFGIYDAVTAGDIIGFDYIGNNKWIPFTCTSASPGVLTCDSAADVPANGSSIVVTQKFGGTLPATSGSFAGVLTTAGASSNTFNVGVNTTSTGAGEFRQITQQSIPSGITPSFAQGSLILSAA